MILAIVGTQLPFDRMVRALDEWAGANGRKDVFAQIGPAKYRPKHIEWTEFLEPGEFRSRFDRASLVVAHAGMGSIIGALETGKPIVIMPRRASLGEHRNDHQVATAAKFRSREGVLVADDERELVERLGQAERMTVGEPISRFASPRLLEAVRTFIHAPR